MSHLIPMCLQSTQEKKACQVFGDDFDTSDGTGLRDYIYVSDLGLRITEGSKVTRSR
jgi:UDP-glucose 4-epimerase